MPMDTRARPAIELLPLPSPSELTEQQVRGITCVWDGVALAPGTAVDLGTRTMKRLGSPVNWFPRACRSCAAEAALRALHEHAPSCEQCVDDAAGCPTGHALNRLVREGRR